MRIQRRQLRGAGLVAMLAASPAHPAAAEIVPRSARVAVQRATERLGELPDGIVAAYFAREDGETVAAGSGAYQFFAGEAGRGAIVWSPTTSARISYGAILEHYLRSGGAQALGFPSYDLSQAPGESAGCAPDSVAHQLFAMVSPPPMPLQPRALVSLCEGADGRVTSGGVR